MLGEGIGHTQHGDCYGNGRSLCIGVLTHSGLRAVTQNSQDEAHLYSLSWIASDDTTTRKTNSCHDII